MLSLKLEGIRKMFLPKSYTPLPQETLIRVEGGVRQARQLFLKNRPNNLSFLLKTRYQWMKPYLAGNHIFELGSGAGFSKIILDDSRITLTDVEEYEWIDQKIDALTLPFEPNSVDVFICSHMIHHVAYPVTFLKNLAKSLKPNGVILISEVNTSFIFKILLRIMKHEGWNYNIDVFDTSRPTNNPDDPWSANCAIPELLWSDENNFENEIKELKIEKNELCEFMIFPLSGGVTGKMKTINLPISVLKVLHNIDNILIKFFPKIFALGRRVVLRKVL